MKHKWAYINYCWQAILTIEYEVGPPHIVTESLVAGQESAGGRRRRKNSRFKRTIENIWQVGGDKVMCEGKQVMMIDIVLYKGLQQRIFHGRY